MATDPLTAIKAITDAATTSSRPVSVSKRAKGISPPSLTPDFLLTTVFHGYLNKEDLTNLPEGYLVSPSQNVITNTAGLVQTRKGYTMDGQNDTTSAPILGSFDWDRGSNVSHHLRSGNSKLQYRYVASAGDIWETNTFTAGQVYWIDLATSLASNYVNFCTFFDTTELINVLLFVQQDSTITEWSGAVATLKSATTNTLTLNGSLTWAQAGFYVSKSGKAVIINGNKYTYTAGETTQTLTGVSGDPTGEAVNSVIHQATVVTSGEPSAGYRNDVIVNFSNQILIGSLKSNIAYLSKINNYGDYTQSSPRVPGDGYTFTLGGLFRGAIVQESNIYFSYGLSGWQEVTFNDTVDSSSAVETVSFTPLKTATLQSALSQGLMTNIGNDVAFVTQEPTLSTLGRVTQNLATPQLTNISDPIKNDFDAYGTASFLDGQAIYHKYNLWVSVPQLGIVRKYNMAMGWWEPPLIMPIGRFSIVDGNLYGHSYQQPITFQLDNGTNDNGNPIHAIAAFSYDNFGDRAAQKVFNEWYVEGYISPNTVLNALTKFDFGGFNGMQTYLADGNNQQILFQTIADGSLGKNPIGLEPIGSVTDSPSNMPKFRVIFTGVPQIFFEYQAYFETNEIDQQWEILAFGPRVELGPAPTQIKI